MRPDDAVVHRRAIAHVRDVTIRYRDNPTVMAWQIENEPFNRSGPHALWVPRRVVRAEAEAVRSLDPNPPLVGTAFAHFDQGPGRWSSRHQSGGARPLGPAPPAQ